MMRKDKITIALCGVIDCDVMIQGLGYEGIHIPIDRFERLFPNMSFDKMTDHVKKYGEGLEITIKISAKKKEAEG